MFLVNAALSDLFGKGILAGGGWLLGRNVGVVGLIWLSVLGITVLTIVIHAYVVSAREARGRPIPVGMEERLAVDQLRRLYNEVQLLAINRMLYLIEACARQLATRNRLAGLLEERHNESVGCAITFRTHVIEDVDCCLRDAKRRSRDLHTDYLNLCDLLHNVVDDELRSVKGFEEAYVAWEQRHKAYTQELRGLLLGSVINNMKVDLRTDFAFHDPREEALREEEERDAIRARYAPDPHEDTE